MKRKILLIIELFISILFCNMVLADDTAYISLDKYDATIGVNYHTIITPTISNGNSTFDIKWQSSDESVATVSNGIVTGKKTGTVYISASKPGYGGATCRINVINNYIPVNGIKINKSEISLLVGETKKIEYTVSPANATNKQVSFSSSNINVATVDQNGNVTGIGDGEANIVITSENYQNSLKVKVTSHINLKSISIDKSIEMNEMETKKINISYNPSNATNKSVIWKSSNTSIATVDNSGMITALKAGEVTITATSKEGGYTSSCSLKIKEVSKKVTGISLDKTEIKLQKEEEIKLNITFAPTYAENKKVTWKSSDTKIVTVDDEGKIKALKAGNAEITVKSSDGGFEAKCKVTVTSLPIEAIAFEAEKKSVYIGSTTTLKTISSPEDSIIENPIWTSSDEEIATIEDGVLKAKKIGETTITVSNETGTISASIDISVIEKPKEKLNIKVEGYNINFNPNTMKYNLKIKKENELKITTNYDDNVVIKGNKNLQDGSIITITYKEKNKAKKEYTITIEKDKNYTIYFIAVISVLLIINIIRLLIKRKKKTR